MSIPDGGCLAWTVVASSFVVYFISDGIMNTFGVLIPPLSDFFSVGKAETALICSIMGFLSFGTSPVAAILVKLLGHRRVVLSGMLISALGFLLSGLYIQFVNIK